MYQEMHKERKKERKKKLLNYQTSKFSLKKINSILTSRKVPAGGHRG